MNDSDRESFLHLVQQDLKNLSLSTKEKSKSQGGLREATEEAIVKVRNLSASLAAGGSSSASSSGSSESALFQLSNQILYPLVQGCESKDPKVVRQSLNIMQRLVIHKVLDFRGARYVTDTLWMLMEAAIEEVKILQTLMLLLTSTHVVQGECLSKCLVIAFRLLFAKDTTTSTIAGATVRQMVDCVFERVTGEWRTAGACSLCLRHCHEEPGQAFAKLIAQHLPKNTDPFVVDRKEALAQQAQSPYLLLLDIVLLVGGEQPHWLVGIVEMMRHVGLELLENILKKFPAAFALPEFKSLLKEQVCPLVIKLFSPNIKYRHAPSSSGGPGGGAAAGPQDRPYYPITSKLLRVVSILILEYHNVLTTETEIFLSLIVKFLDPDKPMWQSCMALEVVHKIAVRPDLLTFVCATFDMNEHSTKVFQDIVNGVGAYVQNVMLQPGLGTGGAGPGAGGPEGLQQQQQQQQQSTGAPLGAYGHGISAQPAFHYRNVWKPLTISFVGGQTKELFLDISERHELPVVSDGYGISLAYACLLDIVRSMSLALKEETSSVSCQQLIESSWCGLLAALSLLLDASTDDSSTENILKALETFASLCGGLDLTRPRDAFLAAICKASLPPHYTLSVLKATASTQMVSGPRGGDGGLEVAAPNMAQALALGDGADIRHQIVAVGAPLPTASLPASAHQGPVMLTAKNLQCMRSILSVAHCHGNLLGKSWHIILTTLQHLVWILGLKPVTSSSGGIGLVASASAGGTAGGTAPTAVSETSSVLTTAVLADLPVLSNMVSRLFESSGQLSESSLDHLIEALCTLSDESMELASSNREPSLFAVAKLLETALVNVYRVETVWRPITSHLLIVCQHPHLRMRQWGCEALTYITRQALTEAAKDANLQVLLLSPIAELSGSPFPDLRKSVLDCLLHVLHTCGESLNQGWPLVLGIIGSIERGGHSDILIRSAFQCLQLVFTDFLPTMPYRCYPQCVDVATKFGSQDTDLNVSLTAVGLLWNLSDYFFQNNKTLLQVSVQKDGGGGDGGSQVLPHFPGCKNISSFDQLWMCLYYRLKDLCLDARPAVRKSAGQTLFSTIAAHGTVLESGTWQAVLWQVLFPLLDNVIIQSDSVTKNSTPSQSNSQGIMMHHSRNTVQKQWAETKVLTISGVVRVFNTKRKLLRSMEGYSKAWLLLLEYVEKMALSETTEVALAALKAMQEMIQAAAEDEAHLLKERQSEATNDAAVNWTLCWKAWLHIGTQKTKFISNSAESTPQGQVLLSGFVQIFIGLLPHLERGFRVVDLEDLGAVLIACVQTPLEPDMDSYGEPSSLTAVHDAVMQAVHLTEKTALQQHALVVPVFDVYTRIADVSFGAQGASGASNNSKAQDRFSLLGEVSLEHIGDFFSTVAAGPVHQLVPLDEILVSVLGSLKTPLRRRYACVRQSNWHAAVNVLVKIFKEGVPWIRQRHNAHKSKEAAKVVEFWTELSTVLQLFLFPDTVSEQRQEDRMSDEAIDCHIVELLRDEVLPFPSLIPPEFIRSVVVLLNRGSIHSSMHLSDDCSGAVGMREDFAKQCFETLLEFSLLNDDNLEETAGDASLTNRLAITSLLQRFREVLVDAIEGERLNRNIPLERQKTAEIAFVLRAITTIIASLKRAGSTPKAPNCAPKKVDPRTWQQVIGLYPYLVQCTKTNCVQGMGSVKDALVDALLQYSDLLQQPPQGNV